MKKITTLFVLLAMISTLKVYSQTTQDELNKCKSSLQLKMNKEVENAENKYFGKAVFAIECGAGGNSKKCIEHKNLCCAPCWNNYQARLKQIEKSYSAAFNACEETYNKTVALLQKEREAKIKVEELERENVAKQEQERIKLANEQIEKEKRLKIEQDKVEKAKSESENKTTASKKDADNSKTNDSNTSSNTYVESEESRKLRERAEAQDNKNRGENNVMGTAIAGVAGVIGGILGGEDNKPDDEDEDYALILKGNLGVSYQSIPVTANYNGVGFNKKSISSSTDPILINLGLEAKFLSNRVIGFNINPFVGYGNLAFSSNTGNMLNYGSNASVKFGKFHQFALKGGYEVRKGTDEYDAAELGIDGITYSKYNYNTLKYGLGLRVGFAELSILKENLSFLKNTKENVYSYEFKMDGGFLGMIFKYSPNYPIAGEVTYPGLYEIEKQDFYQIGMYFRFTILKQKGGYTFP